MKTLLSSLADKFLGVLVPTIEARACTPGRVIVSQSGSCPGIMTIRYCDIDYYCHYSNCSTDSFYC